MSSEPDLIELARERRAKLIQEVARLDAFIETADGLRRGLEQVGHVPAELRAELARVGSVPARSDRPARVVDAALDALRAAGEPLTRGELFERLRSSGVHIDGTDPVKNMGTVLWRSGRFDNAGRRYWIAGERRPAEKSRPRSGQ